MKNTGTIIRSIEEITISAKMNMMDMSHKAIALGRDLLEAKERLEHGKFLPWLKQLKISSSTAANYMNVAKDYIPGGWMENLQYSKIVALLAAPSEEREELAAQADDKSAAEIRKLIEERNRAAEAANAETARANQAEADAKRFYDENAALNNKISVLKNEFNGQKQHIQDLQEKLIIAENEKTVEFVEKAPADYERLKKNQADLMEAAARAEERAAELEEQLEAARSGQAQEVPAMITLGKAMNAFFNECEMMPFYPADLVGDSAAILSKVEQLEDWCRRMHGVLDAAVPGKVVIV